MKKVEIIAGQINLFDMPIQNTVTTKEIITEKHEIKENFEDIISKYKDICCRIIKIVSGSLLVELNEKTMYFNKQGEYEFDLNIDVGLTPGDELLIVNTDKAINELQIKKLNEMNVDKYIKRKGDANIIIPAEDRTIVITPRGWLIEWLMQPIFKEDEVIIKSQSLEVGDLVEFTYESQKCKGNIKSIYNNGNTINVSWDGKCTAFYYKNVKKVA